MMGEILSIETLSKLMKSDKEKEQLVGLLNSILLHVSYIISYTDDMSVVAECNLIQNEINKFIKSIEEDIC